MDHHLFRNLLLFGRALRRLGLDVQAGGMLEVARALEHVTLAPRSEFRLALRTLLVHRREDLARFDEAFEIFWRRWPADPEPRSRHRVVEEFRPGGDDLPPIAPGRHVLVGPRQEALVAEPSDAAVRAETYSPHEVWRATDFGRFTADEMAKAKAAMADLQWDLGVRHTRRWTPGRGRALDLRRAVRRNMKYGGELVELPRRLRQERPRPLVLICDVSGSMERYARMLLHFIHTLATGRHQVEAFLFATRLTRVTPHLVRRGVDETVTGIARAVPDWAGGTRIGEALRQFNLRWARRVLGRGPVVLLISDGWDRGEPGLLGREMAMLQRSCHRLIWLNPLLGSPAYEPLTRGMQAALPFVDDFLPAHNLASLESLAGHLSALPPRRSRRRGCWGAGEQGG